MNDKLLKEFASPGSPYRGKPFWAWNGKLRPEELRRQIRVMHRMGLGGFFMHSRVGLDTPYLSDEWFECVKTCIDEAEKLDMEAWMYDEDRWPSGAAGGLVTKNPKYRQRDLKMDLVKSPRKFRWQKETVAAFTARLIDGGARDVKRLARGAAVRRLERKEVILAFRMEVHGPSSWYNGQSYLDTLNPKAVAEFIKVTHDAYKKTVGKHFGARVPGIFTDEPNYGSKLHTRWDGTSEHRLPWTDTLPAVFKKRYGYDLLPHLVELVFDVDGEPFTRARYHYHDCVTQMFVDAFAKQIGKWCDQNKIAHTGHVLAEDSLSSQTNVVGDCMRFYEYMQAPGMDLLTEHWRVYDTAKQVSSAARQFGRKWRLTETYGCTGWDFPFEGHKALGDWQVALGINNRCQHLSWYTMEGQAKRDYPAGIFYQSPWWEHYAKVEDYFARILAVMTRGVEVRDLLVIHPVESTWLHVRDGWRRSDVTRELDGRLIALRAALLGANIDFDYGDEELLSRHAAASKKKGVPVLTVGEAEYRAVVVPPMITIRSSTLRLLRAFRDVGGTVIFAGDVAEYVDALSSTRAVELAEACTRTGGADAALVRAAEAEARRISITDERGRQINPVLHLLREDKDAVYLFVCNTGTEMKGPSQEDPMVRDRAASFDRVTITGFAGCKGAPVELDPDTGEVLKAVASRAGGGWAIETGLPRVGSRLFVVPKKAGGLKAKAHAALKTVKRTKLGGAAWDVALSEDNCLVLDRPAFAIGGAAWQRPEEILRVDHEVRDALGVQHRGGQMVQPWAREKVAGGKTVRVALKYTFDVNALPSGACHLAIEQPKRYAISLNGNPLNADAEAGWWVDLSLRKIPFDPGILRPGTNTLELTCEFDADHPGLEIVYLLGSFGTAVKGTRVSIEKAPRVLRLGDWGAQGLAFYSGSVGYRTTVAAKPRKGERVFVEVPAYRGVGVRVLVDGRSAGVIGWEPNEVEITKLLGRGAAEVCVEVLGHRRNSHGPLHYHEKWPSWTGPGQFVSGGKQWIDGYQLVPCGLMKPPMLVVKK